MKKSEILKQTRASKVDALNALHSGAEKENRSLTTEEATKFDAIDAEIKALDAEITRAETAEKFNAEAAARKNKEIEKETKTRKFSKKETDEIEDKFSLAKVVRSLSSGKSLDGIEAEMNQEADQTLSRSGQASEGFAIPSSVMAIKRNQYHASEKRAITATGITSISAPSGNEFIDALREYTPVLDMIGTGAAGGIKSGLVGNGIPFPRLSAGAATWEGETDPNADSGAAIDGVKLTSKRLAAKTLFSKQFLVQSDYNVESILTGDLFLATAEAVEKAIIAGASGGLDPTGVINFAGANPVAIGTNGGPITRAQILEMLQTQAEAKALKTGASWLTSARTWASLMGISKDTGSGRFLLENDMMEGMQVNFSNYVPTDLTKGTGTALSAIILGYWRNLLVGQWDVVDIIFDPLTLADNGNNKLIMNSFWDVQARQESAFTVLKDTTS